MGVVYTLGEDHRLARRQQGVGKVARVHLVGQGVIEHHHLGRSDARMGQQPPLYLVRPSLPLLRGVLLLALPDGFPQLLFGRCGIVHGCWGLGLSKVQR